MTKDRQTPNLDADLERVIARTRWAMALERALRAFWPFAAFAAVVWSVMAFGLAEAASRLQAGLGLLVVGVAAGALLLHGLRAFRWPSVSAARARLDERLPGRPLAALTDAQALGREDPGAQSVWEAHRARMARIAAGARPVRPEPELARRDPFALRLMALVVLIAALVFARSDGVGSLTAALQNPGAAAVASGPTFEGWAEPPAYTGRPTLYLPEVAANEPVPVPQGTTITLRVYGAPDRFDLTQTVTDAPAALSGAAEGIAVTTFGLGRSGSVTLRQGAQALGSWAFVIEPDAAPEIELAEPLSATPTGETQLAFTARDDYGVTAGRAVLRLDLGQVDRRYGLAAEPVARPELSVDLPMPLTGEAREVAETLVEDFSKHPWSGVPVTLALSAEDALGQSGQSAPAAAVLPGRRFYDPLAAALVEQRRDLLWSPANGRRVVQVLRAATHRPEDVFDTPRAYLVTRIAIRRLAEAVERDAVAPVVEDVAEMLWQAALILEEGSLGDAAERLERARERLSQALKDDASEAEIAELMEELREATRDYMEQLAQEAIERGETQSAEQQPPQDGQEITQDQIQQLMDRIQELSDQGRKAEAEALLEQLAQLLENLEMQLAEGQQGGQGGEGEQAMQGLSDALREQQGLADESFQQLQREFQQGRQGQSGQGQPGEPGQGQPPGGPGQGGQSPEGTGEPGSLADRQEALRQLTEDLERALPGGSGEATREALREAERNMAEAREGLREGDTSGALDRQSDVIDNLREGMRQMAEDMREGSGQGQQAQGEGEAPGDGAQDPLGRPLGSRGSVGTNESMLPEAGAAARARGLLDEIRRRSGDLARPELELDYLRRLLDRF